MLEHLGRKAFERHELRVDEEDEDLPPFERCAWPRNVLISGIARRSLKRLEMLRGILNPNWTGKMAWDFFVMFLVILDSIILPFQRLRWPRASLG